MWSAIQGWDALGFELCTPKMHSAVWQKSEVFSETLLFSLDFFWPSKSHVFPLLSPRRACSGAKGESWLEQAGCEQCRSCWERGRAAGGLWQNSCPQLACVAITVEMKAQQVSKEFSHGSCWTYKLGPQYNLISWNVKWLKLAASSIGVGFSF